MRDLTGMTVLITGASAGIGEALARGLAARGARLALCARRVERVHDLARELGPGHLAMRADVSVPADCAGFIAEAHRQLGSIDTLVCNAGYAIVRTIAETSISDWEAILRANLLGTTECIRCALPLIRAQAPRDGWRSQVMIVSSALARRGKPDAGAYAATKAAQLSVAEALRVEVEPERIAVTSVHPVNTTTEFTATAERVGGRPWHIADRDPVQDVGTVARAMIRAIERPRPEVWPHRSSRWALGLAGLMPGVVDGILRRRRSV